MSAGLFIINHLFKASSPMLLVTGSTGSGKTTTVKVICKVLGIEIREWINPIDQATELEWGPSQLSQFLDVISDSKYPSLFGSQNDAKRIVLVEDFPNFLVRNPAEFNQILV